MKHGILSLLLALSLAPLGCASAKPAAKGGKSLYQRIGGLPACKALVTGALTRITQDSRVNQYFKGFDLDPVTEHFIQLACAATGGPCKYEGRGMKQVHQGMHITASAFDAVLEDILFTAKKLKVPQAEADELAALFNSLRGDIVELK